MVLHIDQSIGCGLIEDENEQEIASCLKSLDENIKIGNSVDFEIELTRYGLTAMNTQPANAYLNTKLVIILRDNPLR